MAKLIKNELILAKVESTYNTDASPAAGDAILVESLQPNVSSNVRIVDRNPVESTHGPRKHQYGGSLIELSFDVEVKGSGTVDTPPEIGPLLRACGLAENITASTSVDYQPASSGIESITIDYHEGGDVRKMTGARGNVSFNIDTGGRIMASFTFTGHKGAVSTGSVTPTYDSTVPPIAIGAAFDIGGFNAVISNLAFDMGRTVAIAPNMSASDGFGEIRLSDLNVTGSFDPEASTVANNDFVNQFENATGLALDTGKIGSTAGNQVQITMPNVAYREIGHGDREAIRTYDISFGAYKNSGDDQFKIEFT